MIHELRKCYIKRNVRKPYVSLHTSHSLLHTLDILGIRRPYAIQSSVAWMNMFTKGKLAQSHVLENNHYLRPFILRKSSRSLTGMILMHYSVTIG